MARTPTNCLGNISSLYWLVNSQSIFVVFEGCVFSYRIYTWTQMGFVVHLVNHFRLSCVYAGPSHTKSSPSACSAKASLCVQALARLVTATLGHVIAKKC